MNLKVTIFKDLNNLFVFVCIFFCIINKSSSLDSQNVKEAFHDIAVKLVRHCSSCLNEHFCVYGSNAFDNLKFSVLNCWKSKFAIIRVFTVHLARRIRALHSTGWSYIALIKSCKCFWNSFHRFKRISGRNLVLNFLFELLWVLTWNLPWHI